MKYQIGFYLFNPPVSLTKGGSGTVPPLNPDSYREGVSGISFPLFCCFILLSTALTFSQAPDTSGIRHQRTFYDIETALFQPDSVFILNLSRQKLKEFPIEILKLRNLRELNVSRNRLTGIPSEIGLLQNLEILDLSKNKIDTLPAEIGMLINLKRLIMNRNEVESFPPEIGNLSNLETLDAWSNNLVSFPDEIGQLEKLKILDLRVIEINDSEQKRIQEMLPGTKIYFSPSCNCGM
ncbi:MAG: leucine-rich repeat domain-containing protein [Bacteroidetes bacterium]|nr:leucine-rich repeat domain-containing protein [Bacteroidota bacterium]